jgi:hypothetical protein
MLAKDRVLVFECESLTWPSNLHVPSKRSRLFVAADVSRSSVEAPSTFAEAALDQGMVYFCAWGPSCEKFEYIVDQTVLGDGSGTARYEGPTQIDAIMTTSDKSDTLDEALDFFIEWAIPTDGFAPENDYWVAITVGNGNWAAFVSERLRPTDLSRSR